MHKCGALRHAWQHVITRQRAPARAEEQLERLEFESHRNQTRRNTPPGKN